MIITDLKILRNKSALFILDSNLDNDIGVLAGEETLDGIIEDLDKELKKSKIKGAGLSAIQIGLPLRVAIIRTEELSMNLYNAKIVGGSEPIVFKGEGCLSIPNKYVDTNRMLKIRVKNGNGEEFDLQGFEAIVCQHELDHWDGILFTDREIIK